MAYGQGSIWRTKDGTWVGQVDLGSDDDGRRQRRRFKGSNRDEVLAKMGDLHSRRRKGLPPPTTSRETVASWVEHWLGHIAIHELDPETIRVYRCRLAHLSRHYGTRPLRKLTEEHLERLWTALAAEGLSPGYIVGIRRTVGACLKEALRRGRIDRDPAFFAAGPKAPPPLRDGMLEEEAMAVLAAARGDRLEALAVVLLHLGLRNEELRNLRWVDARLGGEQPTLTVRRAKTPAGLRTLEISPAVAQALVDHRRRQSAERLAAGPTWTDSGRIFTLPDGRPYPERQLRGWWHELTIGAGVGRRRVHAGRHTTATLLLDNDTALETVSQILGHSNHAITVDFYGGQARRRVGAALAKMDRVLSSDEDVS